MVKGAGRQAELGEWWEDLWQRHAGSRVVLVRVPPGWGRTTALNQLHKRIDVPEEAPVTITSRVDREDLSGETGLQAQAPRNLLAPAIERHRAVQLLGWTGRRYRAAERRRGELAVFRADRRVSFFVAGLAVGAAGTAWDHSPAGQDGALPSWWRVARLPRTTASASPRPSSWSPRTPW
jgi:hypothetical protein